MAYQLNVPKFLVNNGANTANPDFVFAPDKIVGCILVPQSLVIEEADIDDILTTLQDLTLATGKERVYPVFRFEEINDNSAEETVQELGYGSKSVTKDGKYDWSFRQVVGGMILQNALRHFNTVAKRVLLVDSNNVIYGTKSLSGGLMGCTLDFLHAKPWKANDGSNAAIFHLRLALAKPAELNEDVAFVQLDVDVENNLKGVIDLQVTKQATAAGKATVGLRLASDKSSVYDSFDDQLSVAGAWIIKKAGSVVTPSTVAKNATTGGWDLTFVGTGEHTISLVTPAALALLNVGGAPECGYESDTLTVTMPA